MNVRDKIALVTGAGSGIGRQAAIELSRGGSTVVLVGRTVETLNAVLDEVRLQAPASTVELCDVSSETQVRRTVEAVRDHYGAIHILVNNAGMMTVRRFDEQPNDDFDRHMAVNYYGAVYFSRAVLPIMEKQGAGVILNVASVGGELHLPGMAANSASKAALYAFSEALHYEVTSRGIHVGVVLPGGTRTALVDNAARDGLGRYYRDQCQERDPSNLLPAQVARKIREAIERERFETIVPFSDRLAIGFHSAFPGLFRKYIFRRLRPYLGKVARA